MARISIPEGYKVEIDIEKLPSHLRDQVLKHAKIVPDKAPSSYAPERESKKSDSYERGYRSGYSDGERSGSRSSDSDYSYHN